MQVPAYAKPAGLIAYVSLRVVKALHGHYSKIEAPRKNKNHRTTISCNVTLDCDTGEVLDIAPILHRETVNDVYKFTTISIHDPDRVMIGIPQLKETDYT